VGKTCTTIKSHLKKNYKASSKNYFILLRFEISETSQVKKTCTKMYLKYIYIVQFMTIFTDILLETFRIKI